MCLAIPARVARIDESGGGVVDYLGSEVRTNFALLPGVKAGDWVILHAGFAISRLTPKEARETFRLFKEMEKA
jgi:hydrogenase expression/formation protein HypC